MRIHEHLKMWFHQKVWGRPPHPHEHEEDQVALPEVHTGKVPQEPEDPHPHHEPIHYENVAIPEVHLPHHSK